MIVWQNENTRMWSIVKVWLGTDSAPWRSLGPDVILLEWNGDCVGLGRVWVNTMLV